jgi:hypothetical protein
MEELASRKFLNEDCVLPLTGKETCEAGSEIQGRELAWVVGDSRKAFQFTGFYCGEMGSHSAFDNVFP